MNQCMSRRDFFGHAGRCGALMLGGGAALVTAGCGKTVESKQSTIARAKATHKRLGGLPENPVAVEEGLSPRCTATFHLSSQTCRLLALRELTAQQAHRRSQVTIEGNGIDIEQLLAILQTTVAEPPSDSSRAFSRSGA